MARNSSKNLKAKTVVQAAPQIKNEVESPQKRQITGEMQLSIEQDSYTAIDSKSARHEDDEEYDEDEVNFRGTINNATMLDTDFDKSKPVSLVKSKTSKQTIKDYAEVIKTD